MPPDQSWLSLGQESTGCYPPGTRRLGSEGTLVFAGTCLWGWPQPTVAHTQNLELLPLTLVPCLSLYLCLSWSEAPFLALVWSTAVWEPPFAELRGVPGPAAPLCPECSSSSTTGSSSAFRQQAGLRVRGQTHLRQVCDYGS